MKPYYQAAQILQPYSQTPPRPPICTSRLKKSVWKVKRRPLPPHCRHLHIPRIHPTPEKEQPAQTDSLTNSSSPQQVRLVHIYLSCCRLRRVDCSFKLAHVSRPGVGGGEVGKEQDGSRRPALHGREGPTGAGEGGG